jgi:hypothetical protein
MSFDQKTQQVRLGCLMRSLPDIPRPLEISPENEGKSGLSTVFENLSKKNFLWESHRSP